MPDPHFAGRQAAQRYWAKPCSRHTVSRGGLLAPTFSQEAVGDGACGSKPPVTPFRVQARQARSPLLSCARWSTWGSAGREKGCLHMQGEAATWVRQGWRSGHHGLAWCAPGCSLDPACQVLGLVSPFCPCPLHGHGCGSKEDRLSSHSLQSCPEMARVRGDGMRPPPRDTEGSVSVHSQDILGTEADCTCQEPGLAQGHQLAHTAPSRLAGQGAEGQAPCRLAAEGTELH